MSTTDLCDNLRIHIPESLSGWSDRLTCTYMTDNCCIEPMGGYDDNDQSRVQRLLHIIIKSHIEKRSNEETHTWNHRVEQFLYVFGIRLMGSLHGRPADTSNMASSVVVHIMHSSYN